MKYEQTVQNANKVMRGNWMFSNSNSSKGQSIFASEESYLGLHRTT